MSYRKINSMGYALIIVVGSFLSLFITFLVQVWRDNVALLDLTKNGEAIMISISIIINVIYLLKNNRSDNKRLPDIFFWFSLFVVIGSLIMYIINLLIKPNSGIINFLFWYSIILLLYIFIVTAYGHYLQAIEVSVLQNRKENQGNLENKFENALEGINE